MKRLGWIPAILVLASVTPTGAINETQKGAIFRLILSQLQRCFVPPIENFPAPVTVEVHLKRDGTLSKPAEIIGPQSGSAREQAAIRAISRCAPYHIPSQFSASYEHWKRLQVRFD